jgi:hypothetical protein
VGSCASRIPRLEVFRQTKGRSTFLILDSHIGYGSRRRQDTAAAGAVRTAFVPERNASVPRYSLNSIFAGSGRGAAQARQNIRLFSETILRNDPQHGLANHFLSSITEQALSPCIPAGDDPVQGFADNGIIRRLDDRGQPDSVFFCYDGDKSLLPAERAEPEKFQRRVKLELIVEDSEVEKAVNVVLWHAQPESAKEGGQIAVLEVNEILRIEPG